MVSRGCPCPMKSVVSPFPGCPVPVVSPGCPHPMGAPSCGVLKVAQCHGVPRVAPSRRYPIPWCPKVSLWWHSLMGPCPHRDPLGDTALGHPQPDVLPCDLAPPPRASGWLPSGPHPPGELGMGTGVGTVSQCCGGPNVAFISRMRWHPWPPAGGHNKGVPMVSPTYPQCVCCRQSEAVFRPPPAA